MFASARLFLCALVLLFSAVCAANAAPVDGNPLSDDDNGDMPTEMPGYSMDALRSLADLVQRTGLGSDRIPAIGRPRYLSISDASLSMDDDEVVFVVQYADELVRIYPQRILVWHEVINDVLPDPGGTPNARIVPGMREAGGETFTITYSPLNGAVVAFRSMAGKYPSSFGVSGTLLNGNTVLYDRISRSLWCQLLAVSIEGPLRGKRLDRIPVLWARWGGVKEMYGGLDSDFTGRAEVLSRSTGYRRSYGRDPYGSYQTSGNYYDNTALHFPLNFLDPRLPPKKQILGLEDGSTFGALQKDAVAEELAYNFTLGVVPLVALYDTKLEAVRVFDRRLPGRDDPLEFLIFEGKLLDKQTRSEWLPTGKCTYGPLREKELTPKYTVDAMWFSWAAFYRGTQIFPAAEF